MAFLLGAGVPLKEALPILSTQARGRALRQALPELHNRIMQGESFAQAIKRAKAFPAFLCGFVAIGEMTAQLPRVCGQLGDFYELQAQTEDELAAALLYPLAVTAMMLGVIVMAVAFVLPGYAQVFEASGVALPALTRGLLHISAFVTGNGAHLAAGLCAAVIAAAIFARTPLGRRALAAGRLRLTLFRQGVNLRLVQALSLLLGAGRPVSEAVPVCAEVVGNERVRQDLAGIHTALSAGRAFWAALGDLPYIDPLLVGMARVGEETGRLPQTMEQCQGYFTNNYRRTINRLNKLVEPVITLTLGLLLALVMLAVVLPTFELATAV
jgi:type II secretory pathway component PulF